MAVIRVEKTQDYTVMSNFHFKDQRLSLKAKGLISEMLSLPDEWDYSIAGLVSINQENESAIKSALKELKQAGYLEIRKILPNKDNNGRIDYEYILHEMPIQQGKKQEVEIQPLEILPTEIQGVEIQQVENQGQLNTNILNTKESNTNILKKESKKKESGYDAIMDSVSFIKDDPELRESIVSFIKMRKMIKKPLTDDALKLNINKAYKLAKGDPVIMKAIFEQSVMNSWQGVFELKEETNQKKPAVPSKQPAAVNPFTELRRQLGYDTGANTSVIGEAVGQLPKLQG